MVVSPGKEPHPLVTYGLSKSHPINTNKIPLSLLALRKISRVLGALWPGMGHRPNICISYKSQWPLIHYVSIPPTPWRRTYTEPFLTWPLPASLYDKLSLTFSIPSNSCSSKLLYSLQPGGYCACWNILVHCTSPREHLCTLYVSSWRMILLFSSKPSQPSPALG